MEKPDISEVAAAIPQVRFIDELGTGGFKVAYRAEVNGALEAVKIVRIPVDSQDSAVEEANRKRLRRELALLGQCRTPYLVKLGQLEPFDCRISGREYVCYSEELLQGESMPARIDRKYRPSQSELAQAGSCLFAAIAELAGLQAIHRDIKPDNVFVTDDVSRPFVLHSLRINGYKVINGYSDIIAPFLGAVGAYAGASGWWTNLRTFSLARFQMVPSGGRQPIARYLSVRLLNRVTFQEKEALAQVMPSTTNGLRHDADYNPEPDRPGEALQSWEALHHLSSLLALDDADAALTACNSAISRAQAAYLEIAEAGIVLDRKSNSDHLDSLQNGIQKFRELAGLG